MRTIHVFSTILVFLSFEDTRLDDNIFLIIDDGIKFLGWHTKQVANLIGQRTEIPDMSNGNNEFDVTATFTSHFLLGNLNATTVAHDSLITDSLVLTASTLVIPTWTEDTLTEQAFALRFISTIVNGFGLGDLTERIFQDLFGRCQTDGNFREIILYLCIFLKSHFY